MKKPRLRIPVPLRLIAIVLVVVLVGVAALLMMKKKSHAEDEEGAAEEKPAATAHAKPGTPPTFVPLDPFTVNLADKEVDRFAQIGITLEVADPKFADQLKAYMPAIRNNVLIVLSHKTSAELLSGEGKEKLAREIRRESVRPMGIELDDGVTAPAQAALVGPSVIRLTIHEGRNRQVRRMCEAIGHPVTRLIRTRIGPLADRKLKPGAWRELTTDEVRALERAAGPQPVAVPKAPNSSGRGSSPRGPADQRP